MSEQGVVKGNDPDAPVQRTTQYVTGDSDLFAFADAIREHVRDHGYDIRAGKKHMRISVTVHDGPVPSDE